MQVKPSFDQQQDKAWQARHNVPLFVLARESDKLYRPSAKLAKLVRSNPIPAFRALDRPLVPVLNQVLAKGLTTRYSCADYQVMVEGVGVEAIRLLKPLQTRMPDARFEWWVATSRLVTEVHWRAVGWPTREFAANDKALLAASEEIATLPPAKDEAMHPAGELVAHAFARVERLMNYRMHPVIHLSQTRRGWSLHVGYSLIGKAKTRLTAASLEELRTKFEATFPSPEEALEI